MSRSRPWWSISTARSGRSFPVPTRFLPGFLSQNVLASVTAVSPTDATAVGYILDGNLLRELTMVQHWDGAKWSVVSSPNVDSNSGSFNTLRSVSAFSSNNIYAVRILRQWKHCRSAGNVGRALRWNQLDDRFQPHQRLGAATARSLRPSRYHQRLGRRSMGAQRNRSGNRITHRSEVAGAVLADWID